MRTNNRVAALKKNFQKMFTAQTLLNVRILNVVITIFYLYRGLTMVEVFYLGVIFSAVNLIVEIPSSYLADRWGRKSTLILGVLFMFLEKIIYLFANSFFWMAIAITCFTISYAMFTGTDEALIYDTARELGEDEKTLSRLGSYFSAQRFAKIFSPIVGALIAKDLLEWQFQVVIGLDALAIAAAFFSVISLVEPHHRMDVEKQQKGAFRDALALVSGDGYLLRLLLNKFLIFMASFLIWRIHQQFFIERDVSLIALGIIVGAGQAIAYFAGKNTSKIFPSYPITTRINLLNYIFTASIVLFTLAVAVYPNKWILLFFYVSFIFTEPIRWAFYSELMNKRTHSFNRATSLSVGNLVKSALDVPLLLIGSFLIAKGDLELFIFATAITLFVVVFLRIKPADEV